jgi:acyl transferase domain-containing protein
MLNGQAVSVKFSHPYIPLLLCVDSKQRLEELSKKIKETLQSGANIREHYLPFAAPNSKGKYKEAIVVNQDTGEILASFKSPEVEREYCAPKRPVAFMFAGIGNQRGDMARGLYETVPYYRSLFDECCDFLNEALQTDIKAIIFTEEYNRSIAAPASSDGASEMRELLEKSKNASDSSALINQTGYSHCALFVVEYCLAKTLIEFGVIPDALIGHSLGEYTAAAVAGAITLKEALRLVSGRAALIETLNGGAMLTVLADKSELEIVLSKNSGVFVATENSPISYTISGLKGDIALAQRQFDEMDAVTIPLSAAHPFHSPLMEPVRERFKSIFDGIEAAAPSIPYISNVTGDWITYEQVSSADKWFDHTCRTVKFSKGIEKLLMVRDCALLEVGPGQVLTGFVYQHMFGEKSYNTLVMPTLKNDNDHTPDELFFLNLLCKIWVNNVQVDWDKYLAQITL